MLKYRIFFFSKKGSFNLMRVSQKRFFSSLSSRIKCVQQSLLIFNTNPFYFQFSLNSEEKLLLTFSLSNIFFFDALQSFVTAKSRGFSFSFNFPLLYNLNSEFFINESLLCILDFHSDKHCFGYKPFRSSSDIFLEIKSKFSDKFSGCVFSITQSLNFRKIFNNSWFLKNLSLNRKVLFSWFSVQTSNSNLEFNRGILYNDLHLTLTNFLFYGLLWILI